MSRATLLAATLVLAAGCSADGDPAAPDRSAATESSSAPATPTRTVTQEQIDTVQTDAPVTSEALILTWAEFSTDTGAIEASAFVQGAVEVGGSCTLTAVQRGSEPVVGEPTAAEPGPSSTDCGPLRLPMPADSDDTWSVSVAYSSPSHELTSETLEVEIP